MPPGRPSRMRVAINLLTENPGQPFRCPLVLDPGDPGDGQPARPRRGAPPAGQPEVAAPAPGLRTGCHYITYPWSNERRNARTLSEHLYSPVRLPLSRIDVFNTLMAPLVNSRGRWSST